MTALRDGHPATLLGLRIMTLLHRQQKSVYALAKQADLPVKTVQRICKGEGKQSSIWTIAAIAQCLGVSVDYLVGLTDDDRPYPRQPHGRADADTPPTPLRPRKRSHKAAPVA